MVTSQAWPNKNKPWLGISNTWPNLAKYNKARLLQHNQAVQATTHYFSRSKVTIEDPEMIFKRALLPPYFRSQPQTLFHRNYYNPVPPDSNQQATQLSSFLLVWISPTTTNNPLESSEKPLWQWVITLLWILHISLFSLGTKPPLFTQAQVSL